MAEAGATVARHVAAHHALGEPRLERLVDDEAVLEVAAALFDEGIERHVLRCGRGRLEYAHHLPRSCAGEMLDLPDALSAIAAIALDDARTGGKPRRQIGVRRFGRPVLR